VKIKDLKTAPRVIVISNVIGGQHVGKYAYSPHTAGRGKNKDLTYDWYADTTLVEAINSEGSETVTKHISVFLMSETKQNFYYYLQDGTVEERIMEVIQAWGGDLQSVDGYWRGHGY
jgi:hypothetical protein